MGFFRPSIEKQLEESYASMFGQDMARALLGTAKEKLATDRSLTTAPIPLADLNGEGVTSTDWSWWWDHQPLERAVMVAFDQSTMLTAFLQLRKQGLSPDDAHARLRRGMPVFGDPRSKRHDLEHPDDRPLPRELKNRVNEAAPQLASAVGEQHSSLNAQARDWIRRGRL